MAIRQADMAEQVDIDYLVETSFFKLCLNQRNPKNFKKIIYDLVRCTDGILSDDQIEQFWTKHIVDGVETRIVELSPLRNVHKILWHALRQSPAMWSLAFVDILTTLHTTMLVASQSEATKDQIADAYPPLLIKQIGWLLRLQKAGKIDFIPMTLYMPCNLQGLRLVLKPNYEFSFRIFCEVLQDRGWWFGLPGQMTLKDIPFILENPPFLNLALCKHNREQILCELERCKVEIAAVPGFMKGLIPKCAESIQSKVLVLYWDTFSDADLESLVKGLKGNNHQPFLEAVESKIKNRHQFFMLLKWGFNPRAATTLDFIRRHLKFIESDHDALEVFQWFYAKSEDFEQVTTLIALLADHSPNSESEIKKIAKAPDSAMGAALLGFFRARKKTSADSDDAEDLSYEGDENDDENEIHLSSSDYEISV